MRAPLLLAATFLALQLPMLAQNGPAPSDPTSVREQIEANDRAIGLAIRAHDLSTLEKFWSPQMVVNAPENTIRTREDVFADMRKGGLTYTSLKGTVESFKVFGDIAVQMGHEDFVMAAGPSAGKPLQRRFTNIWQRTGDHWVQIARQATVLDVSVSAVYGSGALK